MPVSIIIPALNEEYSIQELLQQLQIFRNNGHEVVLVDGGSNDHTIAKSTTLTDQVITSSPGRAVQMNKGVSKARHDIIWFLHADTLVPENAIENIEQALNINEWGRFNIKLSGSHLLFRIIEKMINVRSCLSGIASGDQGIFVKRDIFDSVKGFSEIPIMEDIELSKKLKKISKPICLKNKLVTSSRRWEKNGILATILLMWRLRFLYFIGSSPDKLARFYK